MKRQSKLKNAVFITGAGQRIGYHLAKRFLQQQSYPVVFTYRTHHPQVDELQALGAVGLQVDFSLSGSVERLLADLSDAVESLRAVIHNASLWQDDTTLLTESQRLSLWQLHVDVPYQLNQLCYPLLQGSDSALKDIVSLSDFSVNRVSADHVYYLSTKSALQTLSKGFAKKYAPDIKVNDIAPALIMFNAGDSEAYQAQRLSQSALKIEPGPEVVWQAVQYLMNSPYTTGSVLTLDGGRSVM